MEPIDLFVLCLATGRLSYMILYEDGPFDVFRSIRHFFHTQEFGPNGDYELLRTEEVNGVLSGDMSQNIVGRALDCYYCTSVWIAALCYVTLLVGADFLLWVLSASAIAIVWEENLGHRINDHGDSA